MIRVIAFCDPGLDRVSIAVFRYELTARRVWRFAGQQDKIRELIHVQHVKTFPADTLPVRLLEIGRGVHKILKANTVERFYVEVPAVAGNYSRRQGQGLAGDGHGKFQADMQTTHYATGAIITAAGTVLPIGAVECLKALRSKKEQRLENVRSLLVSIGRRAEVRNADDLDAIALGIASDWPE